MLPISTSRNAVLLAALAIVTTLACSSDPAATPVCTAGQSVACTGPAGCSGGQVCKDDGSGFSACVCGSPNPDGGSDASLDATPADGGPDASGFTPTQLSGLALWLEGDVGVQGNPVSSWQDQSGKGNHATKTGSSTITVTTKALNGRDVVSFPDDTTTQLQVAASPTLDWGTADFSVLMVAKADTLSKRVYLWGRATFNTPPQLISDTNGTSLTFDFAGGPVSHAASTGYHTIVVRRAGASVVLRVDGTTTTQTGVSNVGGTSASFIIGPREMSVAEVIAVTGSLADIDLAKLETYAKSKYGL